MSLLHSIVKLIFLLSLHLHYTAEFCKKKIVCVCMCACASVCVCVCVCDRNVFTTE